MLIKLYFKHAISGSRDISFTTRRTIVRKNKNPITKHDQPTSKLLIMSKLSPALKNAISAAHARPNTVSAPQNIRSVYEKIVREGQSNHVGMQSWLTISVSFSLSTHTCSLLWTFLLLLWVECF